MKLKGDYNGGTQYSVGDAVKYKDGHIYHMFRYAKAGTEPADTAFWVKVGGVIEQSALFAMDVLETVSSLIPKNINDEAITLKGTGDAEYLVTVDDSGETPELEVTLIEEEEEE